MNTNTNTELGLLAKVKTINLNAAPKDEVVELYGLLDEAINQMTLQRKFIKDVVDADADHDGTLEYDLTIQQLYKKAVAQEKVSNNVVSRLHSIMDSLAARYPVMAG